MDRRTGSLLLITVLGAAVLLLPAAGAMADEAEPAIGSQAWYWKTQQSQAVTDPTSGSDAVTIEAPNPFCPSTSLGGPPEEAGTCKSGRLPVQVQDSDYEEPEMVSAVAFDLSLVPIGSEVRKFEVTFLEAQDDQSRPANAENKSLQACLISNFFGDGEARQYKERPNFECSKTDPIAKRKATKVKTKEGNEDRFAYTFDLTQFAATWVGEGTPVSAIMIYPVQPKEADFDATTDSNWRVVLDGPGEKNGVTTSLTYKPAALDPLGGDDLGGTDPGDSSLGSTGSTGSFSTGGTSTGSADFSDGAGTETSGGGEAEDAAAPIATDTETASAEIPLGLPAYAWLALAVGLIASTFVWSTVMERNVGVRPDGVLSQIRQINTEKRGGAVVETSSGGGLLTAATTALNGLGDRLGSLFSKLPGRRKG